MNDHDDSGYKKRPGSSSVSSRRKSIRKELSALRSTLESRRQKSTPTEKANILEYIEGEAEDSIDIIDKYSSESSPKYLLKNYRNGNSGKLKREDAILVYYFELSYNLSKEDSERAVLALKSNIDATVEIIRSGKDPILEPIFQAASNLPTAQSPALVLPDAPPKYPYAPRMEGGIVKYLEDNWATYIKAGALTRPDLSRIDPKAYQALRNWLSLPENQLPEHLHVPTKTEALDREIASLGGEDRLRRLSAALASRERRRQPS